MVRRDHTLSPMPGEVNTTLPDRPSVTDHSLRHDMFALLVPFLLLALQGARTVATGTLHYIADPLNPKHNIGDLARYVNMALPNGDFKLAHEPPFVFRVLIPLLVHGLFLLGVPFESGFFSITSLALTISTIAIYYLVRGCNVSRLEAACATVGYVTIYWAVAYNFHDFFLIDASAQAFIVCILLAVQRQRFNVAILLATIGILCNERTFLVVAVGVIQLMLPYLRPLPRTFSLLMRAKVGQALHNVPRKVWLQFVAFLVLPTLVFQIVHHVQQPYYNTYFVLEVQEYFPMHFRYGQDSLMIDFTYGTFHTFGSLFFPALIALLLRLWPRTQFSLWSYVAALLIILFSFTLSGDLQRLTVVGWPFIIMLAAVAIHGIAKALNIAVAWLWGIVLSVGILFQLSLVPAFVPRHVQPYINHYSYPIMFWISFLIIPLAVMAWTRSGEILKVAALPLAMAGAGTSAAVVADLAPDILKTTKRAAIRPATPYATPHDPDGLFWMQMRGGLTALGAHNAWQAQVRLNVVIESFLNPLMQQARQRSPSFVPLERHTLAGPQDFAALWQAYFDAITAYQAARTLLELPHSPHTIIERDTLATLNSSQKRMSDATSSVLSWRLLSIVLPAYNEAAVIGDTIWDCLRVTEHYCPNVEIIVVNDGSQDGTGTIIDDWAAGDARVRPIHLAQNQGYGSALVAGFTAAQGEWIFFMDSDGQFDIRQLTEFVELGDPQPQTAILGYRALRSDPLIRKLNAWGWKGLTGFVLGLHGVRDIDCAFKLLPASAVHACQIQTRGAMINTEMLIKFQRMQVPLMQVRVNHFPRTHGKATGANLRVIARAFRELLELRLRLKDWKPALPATRQPS